MKKQEILARIAELKPGLERDEHITAIAVFGSVARDKAGPDSDIDILVEFRQTPGFFGFVDLQDRLSRALGVRVDLFTKAGLHPALRDRILSEAVYA